MLSSWLASTSLLCWVLGLHQLVPTYAARLLCSRNPAHASPDLCSCRAAGSQPVAPGDQEVFLAFGRVFAGVLQEGDRMHVLQSTYSPAEPSQYRQECTVTPCAAIWRRCLQSACQTV